jgi:hypothetical protein
VAHDAAGGQIRGTPAGIASVAEVASDARRHADHHPGIFRRKLRRQARKRAGHTPTPSIPQLTITWSMPIAFAPPASDESASVDTASDEASSEPDNRSPAPSPAQPDPTDSSASDPSTKLSPNVQFGIVKGAPPGQVANVMVQTAASTICSLKFVGPDNTESSAEGFGSKTTDAHDRAYWEWKVDPQMPTGIGTVTATWDDVSVSVPMCIGGVG